MAQHTSMRSAILIGLLMSATLAAASSTREAGALSLEKELTAGAGSTCILREDGTARCWGLNGDGQLGNGSTTNSSTPVQPAGLAALKDISTGGFPAIGGSVGSSGHSCAVQANGTVRCWGKNGRGELGDGTTNPRLLPVLVSGISNARMVAAGGQHTCALLAGGTVSCWGDNQFDQLGSGTTAQFSSTPVAISGLTAAVAISAGGAHTCALLANSTVKCWGLSANGQLGGVFDQFGLVLVLDGVTEEPVTGFIAVTAGNGHSCGLRFDGSVWCWGPDDRVGRSSGRLAAPVANLSDAVAISAGGFHSCAVRVTGTAVCWGSNTFGQIGDGTSGNSRLLPVAVTGLINATKIAAGGRHTCAMDAIETFRCWGENASFQLGNEFGNSAFPILVSGLSGSITARAISPGGFHSCAIRANGTGSCWGENDEGQVGDGSGVDRFVPTAVSGLTSQVGIAAGLAHSCSLRVDSTVRCWGSNDSGQLGNGSTTDRFAPVQVSGINVVAVTAGGSHSCALRTGGTVHCWGSNENGQLGDGKFVDRTTPIQVSGLNDAIAIAAGGAHTCALRATGTVECWGDNTFGQIGDATNIDRPNPTPVAGLTSVIAIAAGGSHSCAVRSTGTVRCWGRNLSGQLGDGTTQDRNSVVVVSGLSDAVKIAGGGFHTCALRTNGNVQCWGFNGSGQLGDGTLTQRLTPVTVRELLPPSNELNLTSVLSIGAGFTHSCAVRANGDALCWGENFIGQIGDGTATDRLFATELPSFNFNINPNVLIEPSGKTAQVIALGNCQAGANARIDVELHQGTNVAIGHSNVECTGQLESYPVILHSHGDDRLSVGDAVTTAESLVRSPEGVIDQQQWTRTVTISVGEFLAD